MSLSLAALRPLHPARVQARLRLRRFDYDPGEGYDALPEPGPGSFVITGCPRSGTSLAAAALFQPPRAVTLVEPWDGLRMPVRELFAHWRQRVETERRVSGGTLDFDALEQGKVVRTPEGTSSTAVATDPGFLLGIKWPCFFRYLDRLPTTKFLVCIRHPFEILGSMKRLEGSSLQRGQDYGVAFNHRMNRAVREHAVDDALRRIALFDYVSERLAAHLHRPNVFPLRYERWRTDPAALLDEISEFLGQDLRASPVHIAPPSGRFPLEPEEKALVRRHSRMAHRLDYDLS